MWTQPSTDAQKRYYSKHAAERRVFGWITTVLQGTHGFLAFAAWTAIYLWLFQMVPFLMPLAPFLSGATLLAMHVLFRTTWETFWYDRLDSDPNTDSPVWVPLTIIALLLIAEVQGMQTFLAGQVKPPTERGTEQINQEHTTTLSAYETSWEKEKSDIEAIYRTKELAAAGRFDRKIRSLVEKVSDSPAERAEKKRQVASLRAQRDAVLQPIQEAKAAALETAYNRHSTFKGQEMQRKTTLVAAIDSSNTAEYMRFNNDMKATNTYSWLISVALLFLIAALSYRSVKINVESGILPLRNYTVLDAHGSLPERIWTALADAINRRGLQLAVWLHRTLSPREAITTFDGTVVAKPGEYNTPEGFFQKVDDEQTARQKVAMKIMQDARDNGLIITPEILDMELDKAKRMNGSYMSSEFGKKPEPAPASAPLAQATPTPSAQPTETPYADRLEYWKIRIQNMLDHHDAAYRAGDMAEANAISNSFGNPHNPIVVEGNRLNLEWAIIDGHFQVRRRDRKHWTRLENMSVEALDNPTPVQETEKKPGTVTQEPISVTQINNRADEVVKYHTTELQREPSNYANRHASNVTVAQRVTKKLEAALAAISELPNISVPRPTAQKMARFLAVALPDTAEYLTEEEWGVQQGLIEQLTIILQAKMQPVPAGVGESVTLETAGLI